jgi:hypothetical protein
MTTTTTASPFVESFRAARRAATPLLAVTTPDPAQTIRTLLASFNGTPPPCLTWDIVTGLQPLNKPGQTAVAELGDTGSTLVELLDAMRTRLLPRSVFFLQNAHRYITDGPTGRPDAAQAVWNLRDAFKGSTDNDGKPAPRTCVLLGPEYSLPAELRNDVVMLDEPRPDETERAEIARSVLGDDVEPKILARAVDATAGLSSFLAEQNVAMSLRRDGLDVADLWQRQRAALETTRGIKVEKPGLTFADAGGLDGIKARIAARFTGPRRPKLVVRIDEIDKQLDGGTGADGNGTGRDQIGVLLREMDDRGYTGFIAYGGPGTGKTLISNTIASEYDVLCITIDLPALLSKWVGESQGNVRECFRVIFAIAGQGGALWVATCNRTAPILPEVRRRFRMGTYTFDLPSATELDAIWPIQLARYGLPLDAERPACDGWTGSDVRNVCEEAAATGLSLVDAAAFIVPVSKADPDAFAKVRSESDGKYLAAGYAGVYMTTLTPMTAGPRPRRALARE